MKRFSQIFLIIALLAASAVTAVAQQPYKHSIGLSVGSFEGVSYKVFLTDEVALQTDLGFRMLSTQAGSKGYVAHVGFWTFEANPNALYQANITGWNWGGLNWYAGGGLSLGLARDFASYADYNYNYTWGKFGINAIGGLELGLDDAPLAFSFDFRPGYGLLFDSDVTMSFFDWALVVGIRYIF